MRADRLLSALLLLQAHGRLTGRELAKRLEVSARTVHRDMEALGAAGVPVLALRGSRGGWQLDPEWRTQVPGLDEAELRALLMAEPRVIGDAQLAGAARRALGKLMAAMPATMREQAASIRQRLYIDTTSWWRDAAEDLSMLPLVQDAVARDRKLAMTYRDSERVVDPLGLVAKGSTWYLVAQTAEGLRTFRVSRIALATILDVPAERPPDFDLAAYWTASANRFQETVLRFDTVLRAEVRAANDLQKWRPWSPVETASAEGGDRITMNVQFETEEQAVFVALGLGSRVEVLAPDHLRERVAAETAVVSERYAFAARSSSVAARASRGSAKKKPCA